LHHPVSTSGIGRVLEYLIRHPAEYIIIVYQLSAHLPYNNQCLKPAMSVS